MKPIRIKFLISEQANFFFFVDNLTFPIDTMHKEYIKEWLKHKDLTSKETQALEEYQEVRNNLGRRGGREFIRQFEAIFYQNVRSETKIKNTLSKFLGKQLSDELEKVFSVFRERFYHLWEERQPILKQNLLLLKKRYHLVQPKFYKAFSAIGRFYGARVYPSPIEVYLIMRDYYGFVGGRMISQKPVPKIMIESGVIPSQNQEEIWMHLWLLLLHELTHACFGNEKFKSFLSEFLKEKSPLPQFIITYPATKTADWATRRVMQEMIINTITLNSKIKRKFNPEYKKDGGKILGRIKGWLKKTERKRKYWPSVILKEPGIFRDYISWKLEKTTNSYLGKKSIDKHFLNEVYKLIRNFPDNLLEDLKEVR